MSANVATPGPILTPHTVAAWLSAFPDERAVGWTDSCSGCPLAELARLQGFITPFLTGSTVSWVIRGAGKRSRPATYFEQAFTTAVDALGRARQVTAGEVRTILAERARALAAIREASV